MNPHESLLAAFHQGDDPTTAALVIADWLDEHDQPERAAIIRGLAQRRGLLPGDERIFECDEAVERARGQLSGQFLPTEGHGFDEGTPFATPSDFPRWASRFYPTHLSRAAVISFRQGDSLAPMFASPWIERIGSLELHHCGCGTDIPEVMAREGHRLHLKHLWVDVPANWSVEQLRQVVGLKGLRSLSMTVGTASQLRGAFSELPSAPTLERLEIRGGRINGLFLRGYDDLIHWHNPKAFPRLRQLVLHHLTFVNHDGKIDPIHLGDSSVTEMSLTDMNLPRESADILGTLPLQILMVTYSQIRYELQSFEIFMSLIQSKNLRRLGYISRVINLDMINGLRESPACRSLSELDLTDSNISSVALDELLACTSRMQLQRLILPIPESGVRMLESLATHLPAGVLRELVFGFSQSLSLTQSAEGFSRLICCPGVSALRTMSLRIAPLGEAGIDLIARLAILPELRQLILESTGATPAAIIELMCSPRLPKLSLIRMIDESWLASETPTLRTGWEWFRDRSQAMAAYAIRGMP